MKLRTSFFNMGVLRKQLTRFAPVWILYAVAQILCLVMLGPNEGNHMANELVYVMGPVAIFHCAYALIVAACLFGDLFDSRLCNGLHAMPLRREGWLLTGIAAGLLFALIPAVVSGAVAAVMLKEFFWIALVWQGSSLLQFVFFFGLAVFSALCAGKRLGMVAIYGLLNILSLLIFWAAKTVYEPLIPGVVLPEEPFLMFCPVFMMFNDRYIDFYNDKILGGFFRGWIGESWNYLYLCAGIGVVLLVLAWLLYRKRDLETAGNFISFRPMRIFFLVTYTVAAGIAVNFGAGLFMGIQVKYGLVLVGILIGWYTGWMLLERSVKIFTKKVLLSFAAFAVVFAGSIGLTLLDPMGIVSYIPKQQDIQAACLYPPFQMYQYETLSGNGWDITQPEEIAQVQQLHRLMIAAARKESEETITINVHYRLKNGARVSRRYQVPVGSDAAGSLKTFLSDERAVLAVDDWQQAKEAVKHIQVYPSEGDRHMVEIWQTRQWEELFAAIEADSDAGTLAQHDYFHLGKTVTGTIVCSLEVIWEDSDVHGSREEVIYVYEDMVNLSAWMEKITESLNES